MEQYLVPLDVMKNWLVLFICVCATSGAFAQSQSKSNDGMPILSFEKFEHKFGRIKRGDSAWVQFTFINEGTAPVVLKDVKVDCSCTSHEWNYKPVEPGDSSFIKAIYDTDRLGPFESKITVKSNSPQGDIILTITGDVMSPEVYDYYVNKGKKKK